MNTPRVETRLIHLLLAAASSIALAGGCNSPYRSDQGALFGGLTGAGLGALVGSATGNAGAGAAIGAGVGAVSGAAVGGSLDDIEASNRAEIAARLGRPVPTGSVTIDDVIAMTRAGVTEDVIVTHVSRHGAARPPQAGDLIVLQQQGVSPRVVQALQNSQPPVAGPPGVVVAEPYAVPAPVYWGPPYPYPYPYAYPYPRPCYYGPRRGGVHWGVSVGH
ncbi:MAG: glycine zipper domain-containing protein [Pirellulales bacterium]